MLTSLQIFISFMYNTFPCNIKKYIIYYSGTRSTRKKMSCEGLRTTYQILPGDVLPDYVPEDVALFWAKNCLDFWGTLSYANDNIVYKINPILQDRFNAVSVYPNYGVFEHAVNKRIGGLDRYWQSLSNEGTIWNPLAKNNFVTLTYQGNPNKLIAAGTVNADLSFTRYFEGDKTKIDCQTIQTRYDLLPGDVLPDNVPEDVALFWAKNCLDFWGKLWITVDSGSYKINFSINSIAKGNNMLRQYPSFSEYERAIKDGVGGLEINYWTSALLDDYFWLGGVGKDNFFTLTYNGDPKKLIVAGTVGDNFSIIPFNLNVDQVLADKQKAPVVGAVPVEGDKTKKEIVNCKDLAKSKGIVPGISNGNATEIDLVEFDKKCNSWAITTYNNFKEKPVEKNKISATPIIPGSTTRERREDWECNWYFEVNPSRTPPKCYETTVKQDTFCAEMANYLDITATDCGALPEVWGENWNKVCVKNQCPNALNNLSCDALQKKYRIFPNDFGTLPKSAVYIWNQKCNAFWGSLKIYRYNGNYTVTCVINPAIQDNNNILRVYATYQDFLRAINEQIGLDIYWAKINTTSSTLSLNLENKDYFFTLSYKGQPNVLIASGFPTYPDPYSVANKYITVDITNNSFKINFTITQIRGYNSFSVATFNLIRVIDGKYLLRETAPTLGTRSYSFDNVYSGKYTAALEIIMGMDVDKSYVEFQIAGDATLLEKERMAREQSELDYFQTHTCELNRIHFGINMNSFGTLPSSKHGEWRQKCGDMFGWTGCWTCK